MKGHIQTLQRALNDPRSTPEQRLAAFNRLNTAISDLTPLEQIQQEAAVAFEALVRAGGAGTPADLDAIRLKPKQAVRRIDGLVSGLDPDVSFVLIVPLSRLRTNAIGSASIMAARQVELKAAQDGRRLTVENTDLSVQLSEAVESLVAASKRGIATATERTEISPEPRPAWPDRGRRAQPDQLGADRMVLRRPQCGRASDQLSDRMRAIGGRRDITTSARRSRRDRGMAEPSKYSATTPSPSISSWRNVNRRPLVSKRSSRNAPPNCSSRRGAARHFRQHGSRRPMFDASTKLPLESAATKLGLT